MSIKTRKLYRIPTFVILALFITPTQQAFGEQIRVTRIIDGDTIELGTKQSVRLLQIDTPEMRDSECYAKEASVALANILKQKGTVKLTKDPDLDEVDSYGRLLRYIFVGKTNVNLKMVEIGAAAPYFFRRELGKYSKELLAAAQKAKANNLGLWRACPGTKLNPYSALTTVYGPSKVTPSNNQGSNCDPNYQGCVPPFPPDLNCPDIKRQGLAPVRVIGQDVHKLDRDGDGIGCD